LEKYALVVCLVLKFICIFKLFPELTTSVLAAHAGRTHAVIKYWGLSGIPSASLAGKFSNGG
jgi:hypothetical protein